MLAENSEGREGEQRMWRGGEDQWMGQKCLANFVRLLLLPLPGAPLSISSSVLASHGPSHMLSPPRKSCSTLSLSPNPESLTAHI